MHLDPCAAKRQPKSAPLRAERYVSLRSYKGRLPGSPLLLSLDRRCLRLIALSCACDTSSNSHDRETHSGLRVPASVVLSLQSKSSRCRTHRFRRLCSESPPSSPLDRANPKSYG